jgi:hypothetical protein
MRSLAFGVTIPDRHKRLARLETDNASLLAAHGAAAGRRIVTIIHFNITIIFLTGIRINGKRRKKEEKEREGKRQCRTHRATYSAVGTNMGRRWDSREEKIC